MESATPYVGMILAQAAQVGLMIVSKIAMSNGMTNFSFIFYSEALASIILFPIAFFIHRRSTRPPLTFSLISGFFLLGLFGCSAQITGYAGINYTSASFTSAMLNLIPGFTFIFAVIFRMEKADFRTSITLAKSFGTIVSIVGAFILTFYTGPTILASSSSSEPSDEYLLTQQSNWVIGGVLLTIDCILTSAFIIVEAKILKLFPAELIIVFFYCFFTAILSGVVSLIVDKDFSSWKLQSSLRVLAVLYAGVFGCAFQVSASTWCLRRMGPLFVAMFHPLGIIIAAALEIAFFQEALYLGNLLGSIIIVLGFYCVMWAKSKERKVVDDTTRSTESKSNQDPLLLANQE